MVFGHLNHETIPQPEQFCLLHATNEEANKNSGKKKRKIIKTREIREIFVIVFSNFLANWRT